MRDFNEHKLVKISPQGMFSGVLAGIAYYFSIPLILLRVGVFALFIILDQFNKEGYLITIYIILAVTMPEIDFLPTDFFFRVS